MTKKAIVLLVDDDEDDREFFCDALLDVSKSVECIQAKNGEEALRLLQSEKDRKPDYIFLDLNMPRLNGKQCLAEIKKDNELTHIPVIIYSTSKLKEDKDETKEMGAAHFITKPSSLLELRKAISYVLSRDWEQVPH